MKRFIFTALILIPSILSAGSDPRGVLELEGYANSDATGITSKRARNDFTIKEPVTTDDKLFFIKGYGYNSSGFTTTPRAQITMNAAQTWTTTANGTDIRFSVTPNDSTTMSESVRISSNGFVGIGTTNPSASLTLGSAAKTAYTPSTVQSVAYATNTIALSATVLLVGSTGAITLTGVPTIATPTVTTDYQYLLIRSTANVITFQDESTLAGTNIELGTYSVVALSTGSVLQFLWNGADWALIGKP